MGRAARDGIVRNYKRLRTRGQSPQQLLVASTPTTASPLTTMSASTRSPAVSGRSERLRLDRFRPVNLLTRRGVDHS